MYETSDFFLLCNNLFIYQVLCTLIYRRRSLYSFLLGPLLFIVYMDDIHTVSDNLNFIFYADDTTLSSPMFSFTRGCDGNIDIVSTLINSELNKIADWLAMNKLSLHVQKKTKFMIFHYRQWVITENDIPCLMINNTLIERVTEFNYLGLTVNEYMNWNSHTQKIANKISRTLGVMNGLKRYLPISAMKLMYDSLILSHLQFGITNWGFEWDRISKLQKRALRIMTNSKYNDGVTVPWCGRLSLALQSLAFFCEFCLECGRETYTIIQLRTSGLRGAAFHVDTYHC